jgi:hypothetical protein
MYSHCEYIPLTKWALLFDEGNLFEIQFCLSLRIFLSTRRLLLLRLKLIAELSSGSRGSSLISLLKFAMAVDDVFSLFIFEDEVVVVVVVVVGESFESDCRGVEVAVDFSSLSLALVVFDVDFVAVVVVD